MTDYLTQLEEQKKKAQERSAGYGKTATTLTDRLNQYDQYRGSTASQQIFGPQGDMGNRPKGYDPTKSLAAWFNLVAGRQGLESDIERARAGQESAEGDVLETLSMMEDYSRRLSGEKRAMEQWELDKQLKQLQIQKMLDDDKITNEEKLQYDLEAGKSGYEIQWGEDGSYQGLTQNFGNLEFTGSSKTDMELSRGVWSGINEVERLWREGYSGIADYIGSGIKKMFGAPGSKEIQTYKTAVNEVNTAIRNYISGAAVTKEEERWLKDMMIDWNDTDEDIKGKIVALKGWAKRKAQAIIDTAGYKVDAQDYLETTGASVETESFSEIDDSVLDEALKGLR